MLAAIVQAPEEIAVEEITPPTPAAGQVVIDVDAIGVGYVDVMARDGRYAPFPGAGAAPGLEVVGRVAAMAEPVGGLQVGAPVLGLPSFGGFAERVVVDAGRALPVPAGAAAVEMVGLGLNALVAEVAQERAGVGADEHVLVRGASGGIGVLAVQIAVARGARVTAVTSSAERAARLRGLGVADVLTRDAAPGVGQTYDVVIDTVAGPELDHHLHALGPNGRYVLCGGAAGPTGAGALDALLENIHRSPTFLAFSLNSVGPAELAASWKRILGLSEGGRLAAVVDQVMPLTAADAALRLVEGGAPFGKVVLTPR